MTNVNGCRLKPYHGLQSNNQDAPKVLSIRCSLTNPKYLNNTKTNNPCGNDPRTKNNVCQIKSRKRGKIKDTQDHNNPFACSDGNKIKHDHVSDSSLTTLKTVANNKLKVTKQVITQEKIASNESNSASQAIHPLRHNATGIRDGKVEACITNLIVYSTRFE